MSAALRGDSHRPANEAEIREWASLPDARLIALARSVADSVHGKEVLLRGLIEVTNECGMDCLYCGIRRSNGEVERYRLSDEAVAATVEAGLAAGFRTFVLQGGESENLRGDGLLKLTEAARKAAGADSAITLSFGIRSRREYEELRAAGADRYLMRFETADPELHRYLRNGMTLRRRLEALEDLRAAGFQLGSGFMTGLPGETGETLIANIVLAAELDLDMGGVGPFIPHPKTPLADASGGTIELAIRATALLRLALPACHIPATTAAGTLHPEGRERMLEAGANVLMPNITPVGAKKNYLLYPGKICLDESGFQCVGCLSVRALGRGLTLSWNRGDAVGLRKRGTVGVIAAGAPG
ncbi:MAG: [FeFe] hydrogenase H-cluster radical SAM maturase HydE [Treponema sp. GWB1_62_6]|nr:MAG: [FeFe] hydrogenase H-cluster radical SAM maturase HydE [Treponema sp. GWC1_61_84]OHE66723.1 MAG: [FeFe] hydrogenase H-cluster radical SAM maturase HydE [Treponema sp. GWB1_62_6]OHE76557.1 MAG: [FeFe] hydrogenase H-cluster radical SAM maturase HydE [Treponema sp. RIFOXYC1_FULL_61_9]HCM27597.1 [FeFe] hydrogenase H-cluster radical SAM maturase HydE [Treponema sp.]